MQITLNYFKNYFSNYKNIQVVSVEKYMLTIKHSDAVTRAIILNVDEKMFDLEKVQ